MSNFRVDPALKSTMRCFAGHNSFVDVFCQLSCVSSRRSAPKVELSKIKQPSAPSEIVEKNCAILSSCGSLFKDKESQARHDKVRGLSIQQIRELLLKASADYKWRVSENRNAYDDSASKQSKPRSLDGAGDTAASIRQRILEQQQADAASAAGGNLGASGRFMAPSSPHNGSGKVTITLDDFKSMQNQPPVIRVTQPPINTVRPDQPDDLDGLEIGSDDDEFSSIPPSSHDANDASDGGSLSDNESMVEDKEMKFVAPVVPRSNPRPQIASSGMLASGRNRLNHVEDPQLQPHKPHLTPEEQRIVKRRAQLQYSVLDDSNSSSLVCSQLPSQINEEHSSLVVGQEPDTGAQLTELKGLVPRLEQSTIQDPNGFEASNISGPN